MDEARKQALDRRRHRRGGSACAHDGQRGAACAPFEKVSRRRELRQTAGRRSPGDAEAALAASHTLKGVCGNLSMTALFDLLTRQVAAFRAGDWEGAVALLEQIDQAYARVTAAIREACA